MKVLLDEDVPHPLARALSEHHAQTVAGMGWAGIKNGSLLRLVDEHGFQVFVTGDKNMQNQQRFVDRSFAVVMLSAISWPVIKKHIATISEACELAKPGMILHVHCGLFVPRRNNR